MCLPREILEIILLYCDGETLIWAQHVNADWKEIIAYLDQKHCIWERSCIKDIPKSELLQYKGLLTIDWRYIYENRFLWKNIGQNIEFNVKEFTTNLLAVNVVCLAISGSYVSYGLDSGSVLVYDEVGVLFKTFDDFIGVRIRSIHFVNEPPTIIVVNCSGMLIIYKLDANTAVNEYNLVEDFADVSVYKNFFCGLWERTHHLTIGRFTNDTQYDLIACVQLERISFSYSLLMQRTRMLGENICVVLINNEIHIVERQDASSKFAVREQPWMNVQNADIFKDVCVLNEDVLLTCLKAKDSTSAQRFDLHVLHANGQHSSNYFLPQKVFATVITCVKLHGNTLVFGTSTGWLYFYEVNSCDDWETFDLAKHRHAMCMGEVFGPVESITVLERDGQRVFYVASAWNKFYVVTGQLKVT